LFEIAAVRVHAPDAPRFWASSCGREDDVATVRRRTRGQLVAAWAVNCF
jgi:hypothetical protein